MDTATHSEYGYGELTENCWKIHRSASRSYSTVASPSLLASHPPPNPAQRVFVGTGP